MNLLKKWILETLSKRTDKEWMVILDNFYMNLSKENRKFFNSYIRFVVLPWYQARTGNVGSSDPTIMSMVCTQLETQLSRVTWSNEEYPYEVFRVGDVYPVQADGSLAIEIELYSQNTTAKASLNGLLTDFIPVDSISFKPFDA